MNVSLEKVLPGHKEPIYHLLPFDEDHFLSAAGDGIVAKWNINTYESTALARCKSGIYAICKLNDTQLAIGTNQGILHILDFKQQEMIFSKSVSTKQIFKIVHLKEQHLLLVGDGEGRLTLFNDSTFKEVNKKQLSKKSLRSIAVNEEKSLIAIGNSNDNIHVFSLPDFHEISTLEKSENSVFCLQFLTNTKLLSGGRDAHIRVWDVIEKDQLDDIPAHQFTVNDISLHATEQYFATVSRDKSCKIWQTDNLRLRKVISTDKFPSVLRHSLNTVTWMNNWVVCGGDDRNIFIWKVSLT